MKTSSVGLLNAIFIVATGTAFVPAYAGDNKFTDTSTGSSDTPASLGGITKEEAAFLDRGMNRAAMQKKIQNFKGGRTSSGSGDGVQSRYSGILEMHDADHDGVTDHDGGADALEAASEKHAAGTLGLRGQARQDKMKQVLTQACKGAKDKDVCMRQSKSSVLIDRGPAHGKDQPGKDEEHRVYELDEKVQQDAKNAGKAYADQAVLDASEAVPDNIATKKGSKKNTLKVQTANGEKEVTVGANLDLLRDEAMKLEQMKQKRINNTWKFLRAQRLTTAYVNSLTTVPSDVKSSVLADIVGQNSAQFFHNSQLSNLVETSYKDADTEQNVTAYDQKFSQGMQALVQQSVQARLAASKQKLDQKAQAQLNKELSDNGQKLAQCMKAGVYCYGGTASADRIDPKTGKPINESFSKAKGDPGGTFEDTREYIYERVDAANRGGVANAAKILRNGDLNENTDRLQKGQDKTYATMVKQAEANARAAQDFVQSERAKGKDSTIDLRQYDPNTMSATELSRRNLGRGDGSTLGGIGQGMGQQINGGTQVNGSGFGSRTPPQPGSARQPATGGTGIRN